MKPVIEIYNLSKLFGMGDITTVALDNITLRIDKGEFVCIMGPSGSGKTTLMNIIGLLDTPTHGEYYLDEETVSEISQRKRAKIRRDTIGMIFQNFNLLSQSNIIDNVALPLAYKPLLHSTRLSRASKMLETFGLHEREYYMPYQLSGGQLQRVAIARALVTKPSIILADEPTGNLDSRSSEIIMQELADIHHQGNTIIMVTHNPEIAVYAERIIQMTDGRIASDSKEPTKAKDPTKKRALGTFRQAIEATEAIAIKHKKPTRRKSRRRQ
ncbi:MAG TPA: ABC transporter ATP-binding protein [Patescibacteria group bacterium]|jgi:putative ABC transport system ATP-binding protein|nr:ABC transporter ATP-binding protein [Patescibacteria group bacterium]